eukprot:superscaffoldBa00000061_g1002
MTQADVSGLCKNMVSQRTGRNTVENDAPHIRLDDDADLKAGSSKVKLLEQELKILRQVNHAHIIHLKESYETAKMTYLVTELCVGGELKELLQRKMFFTEDETRHIIHSLADAIVYLHKRGDRLWIISNDRWCRDRKHDDGCLWDSYLYGLCGEPPFVSKTRATLLEKITKKELKFAQPIWATVDPAYRISANQLLENPWITGDTNMPAIPCNVLEMMRHHLEQEEITRTLGDLSFISSEDTLDPSLLYSAASTETDSGCKSHAKLSPERDDSSCTPSTSTKPSKEGGGHLQQDKRKNVSETQGPPQPSTTQFHAGLKPSRQPSAKQRRPQDKRDVSTVQKPAPDLSKAGDQRPSTSIKREEGAPSRLSSSVMKYRHRGALYTWIFINTGLTVMRPEQVGWDTHIRVRSIRQEAVGETSARRPVSLDCMWREGRRVDVAQGMPLHTKGEQGRHDSLVRYQAVSASWCCLSHWDWVRSCGSRRSSEQTERCSLLEPRTDRPGKDSSFLRTMVLDKEEGVPMLSVQPKGKQKGCAGCNRKIKDRYLLKALDKYWHEDCLKCACCDCRLGEVGSTLYTKANLILCRRDYLRQEKTHSHLSTHKKHKNHAIARAV